MFKRKGNLVLLVLLLLMAGIYAFIYLGDQKKGERNFRSTLVDINTEKVTKIWIKGAEKEKPLIVEKSGDQWMVELENGEKVAALEETVNRTLEEIASIKPSRLASKNPSKWPEFKVDDEGTKVEIYEGSKKALDIIIGRFEIDPASMQQTQQRMGQQQNPKFTSFVRLSGEDDVFVVKGFYEGLAGQNAATYRDKALFKGNKEKIKKITYNYPADSSMVLELKTDAWYVNDEKADSGKVVSYLNGLAFMKGGDFVDKPASSPYINMVIEGDGLDKTTMVAYKTADGKDVVSSDVLTNSFFDSKKSSLVERLFVGKSRFFK